MCTPENVLERSRKYMCFAASLDEGQFENLCYQCCQSQVFV